MSQQGTATLDFGAFPGASDASVVVSGLTGAPTLAEAWVVPATTTNHSLDEHWVESLAVVAGPISGGAFTIYGKNTNNLFEPPPRGRDRGTGKGTRLYGKFNIGWVAN